MSVDSRADYVPGDPILIKNIVTQLKSQGVFDQFRKECISDVDTKPAYQNLCHRVDGQVSSYLDDIKWIPDLNKNQLRENIRKYVNECHFVEPGIARIVDQLVNPRINTVLVPKVEDIVYKYIGIKRNENSNSQEFFRKETEINVPSNDGSNYNNYKNNILNNEFEISYSRSDKFKLADNIKRKNNSENFNFDNDSSRSIFEKKEEDNHAQKSPYFETRRNSNTSPLSIKNEQISAVNESLSDCEKCTKPATIDYFADVKLEETRTYSNIESDEENLDDENDLSPPFELHKKSNTDISSSVESDFSVEVFEWKDNAKVEKADVNAKIKNEELERNNLECNLEYTVKEKNVDSSHECSDPPEITKKSETVPVCLDIPKTPTINYETSDESEDNNYLKQSSAVPLHSISVDRPPNMLEFDIPDFSNVDKISQKIVGDNRDDATRVSNEEFSTRTDFDFDQMDVPSQKAIDVEFTDKNKEKEKDDKIDKRKADIDKSISSKPNESKDVRNRDKKHADHKKDKEKHKSDKRESSRSDKDRKSNKEKNKLNSDLTKVSKNSKEKHENRDKNHKSNDEKDRSHTEYETGSFKVIRNKDDVQIDRKIQKPSGDEKKSRDKGEYKSKDTSGKSSSSGENRSKEEKTRDKRLKSDDVKEGKKRNDSKNENDRDRKEKKMNVILNQDEDSSDRKSKIKKSDNSNGKKSSKNQCSSDDKKSKTDRRSSDRDSNGPSSSSHHSQHRNSNKTEREKHSDKSKYSSSFSSHKSKKNGNDVKSNNHVLHGFDKSEKFSNVDIADQSSNNELLIITEPHHHSANNYSDQQTLKRNELNSSNVDDGPVARDVQNEKSNITHVQNRSVKSYFSGNSKQIFDHTKNVDVDDTRLEMMLKSIHGDNEIHFGKYSEETDLVDQVDVKKHNQNKNSNSQLDKNRLKRKLKEIELKKDSEELINVLNDSYKVTDDNADEISSHAEMRFQNFEKNNVTNGEITSTKLSISSCVEPDIKKPKIARNEFEFGKVVKLRKQYREKMRMLQQQGKENSNYLASTSTSFDIKSENNGCKSMLSKHSSDTPTATKDSIDYLIDSKYSPNGANLDKRNTFINDSAVEKIKTMQLNITRVDTHCKIVNGSCLLNNSKSKNGLESETDNNDNNSSNGTDCDKSYYFQMKNKCIEENNLRKVEINEIQQEAVKNNAKNCRSDSDRQSSLKKKRCRHSVSNSKKIKRTVTKQNELTSEVSSNDFNKESNFSVPDVLNCATRHPLPETKKGKNEILLSENNTNILNSTNSETSSSKVMVSNSSYAIPSEDSDDGYNVGEEETLHEINIEEIIGCPTSITRITYESDFSERLENDINNTKDESYVTTEKIEKSEKDTVIYDEHHQENVELKSVQSHDVLNYTDSSNSKKKNVEDEVFYFVAGNQNNDLKKFVEKKILESENICLKDFSITLQYPEKYDIIFQNQLGAIVKRNNFSSNVNVKKSAEVLQSSVKYNSEIINHKSGDDKGIMLRIKMFHETKNELLNEELSEKKKTVYKACDSETDQSKHEQQDTNTNFSVDESLMTERLISKTSNSSVLHTVENMNVNHSSFKMSLINADSSPNDSKKSNKILKSHTANMNAKRRTLGIKRKILNTSMNIIDDDSHHSGLSMADNGIIDELKSNAVNESSPVVNRLVENVSLSELNSKKTNEAKKSGDMYEANSKIAGITSNTYTSKKILSSDISSRQVNELNSAVRTESIESRLLKSEDKKCDISSIGNSLAETNNIFSSKKLTKGQRRNSINRVGVDASVKEVPKRTTNQTKCYYDSSDLYKPRPSFLLTSRRSRALNNENSK